MAKNNKPLSIFLYSNQPIFEIQGQYYSKYKNFIDFLSLLSMTDSRYTMMVPCEVLPITASTEGLNKMAIREGFIKMQPYDGHSSALFASFNNAFRARRIINEKIKEGYRVIVAGPGPNSFLFWLSLLLPRQAHYAFFVRGDVLKTVENIYRGKLAYLPAVGLIRLFRRRINSLLKQQRGMIFAWGEQLLEQFSTEPNQEAIIMPLIERSLFREESREYGQAPERLKILFIGRLSPEKNIEALIDACKNAAQSGNPFLLSIVGGGGLESRLKAKIAADPDLSKYITMLGHMPHGQKLRDTMDSHDALCLPSLTEGIPRAVVESFARRLPVIATKVGALPVLYKDEIVFIDGFDSEAIRQAIEWAGDNREQVIEMAGRGHALSEKFLIENNVQIVDAAITEFAEARG